MKEEKNPQFKCALSYTKSILFYIISKENYKREDIVSSTISAYYSIFHLCDALYEIEPLIKLDRKSHSGIIRNTKKLIKKNLNKKIFSTIKGLYKRRENVNYEPKLYSNEDGELKFYTCRFKGLKNEIKDYHKQILGCYLYFGKFVLEEKKLNYLLFQDFSEQIFDLYREWGVITTKNVQQCKKLTQKNIAGWKKIIPKP